MFLIDSNIWLEIFLNQEKANEAKAFINSVSNDKIFITEFTLYSICIILTRQKKLDLFHIFIEDVLQNAEVSILSININEFTEIAKLITKYNLDFDDAYQYFVAEKYDLTLISFDRDFDITPRGRKEPKKM